MSEKTLTKSIAAAAALLALCANAWAQQTINVQTTVQKQIVVEAEDGSSETQLVPVANVVPGDTVVYTITFENVGDEPADDVVITNEIADELEYVPGSASTGSMRIEFSADGGQTFGLASELTIDDEGVQRPATTTDYTHVRWVMQTALEVGGRGIASFAAVIE